MLDLPSLKLAELTLLLANEPHEPRVVLLLHLQTLSVRPDEPAEHLPLYRHSISLDIAIRIRIVCPLMGATVPLTREEVEARRSAIGWSQNELARRIGRNPGYLSKVLAGDITSSVVLGEVARALTKGERLAARRATRRQTA